MGEPMGGVVRSRVAGKEAGRKRPIPRTGPYPCNRQVYRSNTRRWLLQPETQTIIILLLACSEALSTESR